jgi:hypothetical protein
VVEKSVNIYVGLNAHCDTQNDLHLHENLLNLVFLQLLAQLEYTDYQRAVWGILNKVSRDQVQEGRIWRQIQFLSVIGPAALPPELLDRVSCVFTRQSELVFCGLVPTFSGPLSLGVTPHLEPPTHFYSLFFSNNYF